jgi:hypothetical protein
MTMKHSITSGIFAAVLLLASSGISAKDLSKYPCMVFAPNVCFRLPTGTQVNYSVPADFDLYSVSKGSKGFANIYVGDAPNSDRATARKRLVNSKQGSISIHVKATPTGERLEIYIVSKARYAAAVHISADLKLDTRAELIELLSSFRPCTPISSGGQRCKLNDVWSKELIRDLQS